MHIKEFPLVHRARKAIQYPMLGSEHRISIFHCHAILRNPHAAHLVAESIELTRYDLQHEFIR